MEVDNKVNTRHIKGMPLYSSGGYRQNKPDSFYILQSGTYFKIGITNRKVARRCSEISKAFGRKFEVIYSNRYLDGNVPKTIEMKLLMSLRKVYLQPTEIFSGSTECFFDLDIKNVLEQVSFIAYEMEVE
jgi:hypothetical protein